MLSTLKWLYFRIPWILRWTAFLCLPWIVSWLIFLGILLYTYFQIDPDDREGDVVDFFYSVGRLFYPFLAQFLFVVCGIVWGWMVRKDKQPLQVVQFVILVAITVGLLGYTIWAMYGSYQILYEKIQ